MSAGATWGLVRLVILATAVASLLILAIGTTTASAARTYECQITGSATPSATECNGSGNAVPSGPFSEPWGIAVDSGDNVWVDDPGFGLLTRFDNGGNYLNQGSANWGSGFYARSMGYSAATENLYVGDANFDDIWVIDMTGSEVNVITTIHSGCCYLTVGADNSGGASDGTIYVASSAHVLHKLDGEGNVVDFSGAASYIEGNKLTGTDSRSVGFNSEPGGVAVDSAGNIYASDQENNAVDMWASSGIFIREITETPGGPFGHVAGIAVDPTSDNLLVVDSGKRTIEEFDSSGVYADTTTSVETPTGEFSESVREIAVDSSGRAFVTDAGNHVVQVFSSNVVLPKVNYLPPINATQTSGTLRAEIDPNEGGDVISCKLEYGPTGTYGSEKPCTPDPASAPPGSHFSAPTMVSADISGLTTEATYNYRFVVANANGVKKGGNKTFVPHAVEGLSTDPATEVEPTSVQLNGSWTGNGEVTEYQFEWGTTKAYGQKTPLDKRGRCPRRHRSVL